MKKKRNMKTKWFGKDIELLNSTGFMASSRRFMLLLFSCTRHSPSSHSHTHIVTTRNRKAITRFSISILPELHIFTFLLLPFFPPLLFLSSHFLHLPIDAVRYAVLCCAVLCARHWLHSSGSCFETPNGEQLCVNISLIYFSWAIFIWWTGDVHQQQHCHTAAHHHIVHRPNADAFGVAANGQTFRLVAF